MNNIDTGMVTITTNNTSGYIDYTNNKDKIISNILDHYSFNNKFVADHRVKTHELLKLKELYPSYTDEIKENLSRNLSREIIKKIAFTRRYEKLNDVENFIGRVWVFNEEELKNLITHAIEESRY